MTDDLLNALKMIKAECEKHERCNGCPLKDSSGDCGVTEGTPNYWSLEKREVYF